MADLKCFICDDFLSNKESVVIKERGLKTLIDSSKRRKDGKHILLEGRWFVTVHCNCRKSYVKESNIATSLTTTKNTRRSDIPVFDFKHKCLLCEGDASDEFLKKETKKPVQKRDRVHCVETLVFKDSLLETARNRNDKWGSDVILRVGNVSDLVAAEGRYHGACGKQFFKRISTQQSSKGRPKNVEVTAAFDFVCNYIENNEDQCQFSLREILNDYKGYIPTEKILKKRLIDKYGQEIVIATGINRQPVICFRNTGYTILTDNWYNSKKQNVEEERLRIVKAAADIIREDIRSMVYDLRNYPTPETFLDNVKNDVPNSLQMLLNSIIKKKKNVLMKTNAKPLPFQLHTP